MNIKNMKTHMLSCTLVLFLENYICIFMYLHVHVQSLCFPFNCTTYLGHWIKASSATFSIRKIFCLKVEKICKNMLPSEWVKIHYLSWMLNTICRVPEDRLPKTSLYCKFRRGERITKFTANADLRMKSHETWLHWS